MIGKKERKHIADSIMVKTCNKVSGRPLFGVERVW